MNEEEIRKLIKGNLPIAVKSRNGKMMFPYRNLAIFNLIVDELTEALIKNLPNELRAVNRNEAAKEVCDRCNEYKMFAKKPAYCKYCGDRLIT